MEKPKWLSWFRFSPTQRRYTHPELYPATWEETTTEEYGMAKDSDDFESIVGNFDSGSEEVEATSLDCENPLDIVAHHWKDFHPSNIYIKGILIVESAMEDGRVLRRITTPGMAEWEALGMLESVKQQIIAEGVVEALMDTDLGDDDDGDDD